jgi:predicted nucleic acid-binding protein
MKRYWDASALVDALHDARIEKLALEPEQWTRPHTLSEVFSTLTGGRLGFQYLPDDAAALIREITATMQFVDLNGREIQGALDTAQKRGVKGGRVHDWLHACAAKKAGVEQLLTDNLTDFQGLEDGFSVVPP